MERKKEEEEEEEEWRGRMKRKNELKSKSRIKIFSLNWRELRMHVQRCRERYTRDIYRLFS